MSALTLKTLERLEHFNEFHGSENVGILRCNLHHDLQVLSDIDTEHLVQTSHGLLGCQPAEVIHQPLVVQAMRGGSYEKNK